MNWKKLLLSVAVAIVILLLGCIIGIGVTWFIEKACKGSIYAYLISIGICFITLTAFVFSTIEDSDKKDE